MQLLHVFHIRDILSLESLRTDEPSPSPNFHQLSLYCSLIRSISRYFIYSVRKYICSRHRDAVISVYKWSTLPKQKNFPVFLQRPYADSAWFLPILSRLTLSCPTGSRRLAHPNIPSSCLMRESGGEQSLSSWLVA